MHSLKNLTVFIVNLSTLCSYLCILHLKWCVYQFIIIIIKYRAFPWAFRLYESGDFLQ